MSPQSLSGVGMRQPPGTVSRILWHFTGGPRWNSAIGRQEARPKPSDEAYKALLSILRSEELRLGGYREVVKVQLPKLRKYSSQTRRVEERKNVTVTMYSSPVCCLSDIPIAHLSYHAKRYGKIAIGFHREAAVRHGFNPVFYTLQNTQVIRSIRRVFVRLENLGSNRVDDVADQIESAIQDLEELECDHDSSVEQYLGVCVDDLRDEASEIEEAVSRAQKRLEGFLAFVKTFDRKEFSSIYCEREWRSTKPFYFEVGDIAMVVLPRTGRGHSYFNDFVRSARTLKLPPTIPAVPWEDLIEH